MDNIIEGLTESFAEHYGLEQSFINQFEIPHYVQDSNGKYYKYNYEIDNTYYCPNNIVLKQHEPSKLPKDHYILADYFIIDMKEKTIFNCTNNEDSFTKMFQDNPIKKISVEVKTNSKIIKFETMKGLVTLEVDNENRIIGLDNPYVEEIGDNFLCDNIILSTLNLPNVQKIGNAFLYDNSKLLELYLPNVQVIGDSFLRFNTSLTSLNLPNVQKIGDNFLEGNTSLTSLNLPNVQKIGDSFLGRNNSLTSLNLPNVQKIGNYLLFVNNVLSKVNLPNVQVIGDYFLFWNNSVIDLNLENLKLFGYDFMANNHSLLKIRIPNNEQVYEMLIQQHPEYLGKIEMVESEERKR